MKSISQVFIDHPRLAWVVSIVIALCGTICLFRTPVAEYPNITPVTITVSTTYTGASAEVVNESGEPHGVEPNAHRPCRRRPARSGSRSRP